MKNYSFNERQSPSMNRVVSISPEINPDARKKIISFGQLKEGWDFGQGGPAPRHVVMAALALHGLGEQLGLEMDAFPGAGGDISVDFYKGDELVQVLINTDVTLELTHEKGIGSRYEELAHYENISVQKMSKYLMDFRAKGYTSSWNLSDCYTGESTRPRPNDSLLTASRNSMEQFRLLKSGVFIKLGQKLANTFVDITKPLLTENRLRFGSLVRAL